MGKVRANPPSRKNKDAARVGHPRFFHCGSATDVGTTKKQKCKLEKTKW
jgi:hypothetical protein